MSTQPTTPKAPMTRDDFQAILNGMSLYRNLLVTGNPHVNEEQARLYNLGMNQSSPAEVARVDGLIHRMREAQAVAKT